MVYVSSIANWFDKTFLEEKVYSEDFKDIFPDTLTFVNMVNRMTPEEAESFSKRYVGSWPLYPNNYSFTKTLTEVMVIQEGRRDMRIAIVRSPLLFSCLKQPEAGWFDLPQTGTAMFSLYANGVIRSALLDPDYEFNHLPLDMCANTLITTGWFMACVSSNSSEVFNMNCSRDNPISIRETSLMASKLGQEFPSIRQLRPPKKGFSKKPHPFLFAIYAFFTYTIFSYLVDYYLMLVGRKPM